MSYDRRKFFLLSYAMAGHQTLDFKSQKLVSDGLCRQLRFPIIDTTANVDI
jgi:hypothetical protein